MANNAKCWRLTLALHPGYPHKRVDTPRHQDADLVKKSLLSHLKIQYNLLPRKNFGLGSTRPANLVKGICHGEGKRSKSNGL
jgi:hypothetical protein